MSRHLRPLVSIALLIVITALACNMPTAGAPAGETTVSETPSPTFTAISAAGSETPTPTATTAVEACAPTVTTTTLANVRNGPGQVYAVIGNIPQGGSANVAGRNSDGTWWYIEFAGGQGGYAWISTQVTTSACIPSTLAIIAAPPTPIVQQVEPSATTVAGSQPEPSATATLLTLIIPPGGFQLLQSPTPTKLFIFLPPGGLILYTATPTP